MLIMEPDGTIETRTTPSAMPSANDASLERVLMQADHLGHEIASEVRAMVDAKLASLAVQLGPLSSSAGFAGAAS